MRKCAAGPRRYWARVRISQIRIQVEPRVFGLALSRETGPGRFFRPEPNLEKEKNMKNTEKSMEKLVALCKGRGFVFPGSEIYGGLANTWDYGPLGVEFKNNVKKVGGKSSFRNPSSTWAWTRRS